MNLYVRDVQRLLADAGYYKGGIDNDAGPLTHTAIEKLLKAHTDMMPGGRVNDKRKFVIATQLILHYGGFEPGVIDGYVGHNTIEALNAWDYEQSYGGDNVERPGRDEEEPARPGIYTGPKKGADIWPRQRDVERFYGSVGTNQTMCQLPFTMRLAWNRGKKLTKFSCHERVRRPLETIWTKTLEHYGHDGIKRLGLDMFGGCLNVRKMRGGTRMSMHSWGIAVDIDPARNRLRWGKGRAHLARPEYRTFWRIVESEGAISLGRARNFDWMHFQFARL